MSEHEQVKENNNKIIHDSEDDIFYFNCPHCGMLCQVPRNEIRCTIFRHAVFKPKGNEKEMKFVPPHAKKEECQRWLDQDLVFGCAKPFKFNGKTVEKCDYI